jgi:hypothetical protein
MTTTNTNYAKMAGPDLQICCEEQRINALWVKGRGMVIMPNHCGPHTAVRGRHPLYSRAAVISMLESLTKQAKIDYADYNGEFIPSFWHFLGEPRGHYTIG